jgi:uncharacterized membrane protein
LLLFVAFLPFPTGLVTEHIHNRDAERVAATLLGVTLLLVSTLVWGIWRYAVEHGLVPPDTGDEELRILSQRLTPSLAGYVVLIFVGMVLPMAAVLGYLIIALAIIAPIGFHHEEQVESGQRTQNQSDRP